MFQNGAYPAYRLDQKRLTVTVHGEIDHHSARLLREEIDLCLERHRPRVLELDLGKVTFMDSSGLGFVLGRIARAEEMGCSVEIVNATERVLRILRMAGIGKIKNALVRTNEMKRAK